MARNKHQKIQVRPCEECGDDPCVYIDFLEFDEIHQEANRRREFLCVMCWARWEMTTGQQTPRTCKRRWRTFFMAGRCNCGLEGTPNIRQWSAAQTPPGCQSEPWNGTTAWRVNRSGRATFRGSLV